MAECFVFLSRHSSIRRLVGYRQLEEDCSPSSEVKVVVGKEKREFYVDPFVLEKDPFRVLMEMVRIDGDKERKGKDVIFVDVDVILFEHLLWLVYNDSSSSSSSSSSASSSSSCSFFQLNMKEIIEFYAQDF
ncbi:hypothetical protein DsansV1_C27g0200401 [Dioscorea sansibarensis]